MSVGAPDFGSISTAVFNPLAYPRRVIIQVLQSAFSGTSFFQYPDAPANPFQIVLDSPAGNPLETSQLVVADSFSDELLKTDARPTVIVSRDSLQFGDLAVNARGFGSAAPTVKLRSAAGSPQVFGTSGRTKASFADMTTMPLVINCYARRDLESELLAWLVAGFIRFYEQEIKDGSLIYRLDAPLVGTTQPARLDSQHDLFLTQINMVIYQSIKWVKTTTLSSPGERLLGSPSPFSNLSGSGYPRVVGVSPCATSTPAGLTDVSPDYLISRWFGVSPSPSP
jgi:hypothetical protein